jgi:hypothetical protein
LEAKFNAVINGLGANNSSFLGEQLEASETSGILVVFDAIQVLGVDDDIAWDILWSLSLESQNL